MTRRLLFSCKVPAPDGISPMTMTQLPDTRYSLLPRLSDPCDVSAWTEFRIGSHEIRGVLGRGGFGGVLKGHGNCLRNSPDSEWARASSGRWPFSTVRASFHGESKCC